MSMIRIGLAILSFVFALTFPVLPCAAASYEEALAAAPVRSVAMTCASI